MSLRKYMRVEVLASKTKIENVINLLLITLCSIINDVEINFERDIRTYAANSDKNY